MHHTPSSRVQGLMGESHSFFIFEVKCGAPVLGLYFVCGRVDCIVMRIYIEGEPTNRVDLASFDLAIVAGGANLHDNAVYLPLLPLEKWSHLDFHAAPVGKPAAERHIDVLYRSSNCTEEREKLATALREGLEAENLSFVATGTCTAGGERQEFDNDGWGHCKECLDAKMVIAFENFDPDAEYLSEKPFLGWAHGAVPLYHGNGQALMDGVGLRRSSMVDATSFEDTGAFVRRVVELAKDPRQLDAMRGTAPLAQGARLADTAPLRKFARELPSPTRVYIDNPSTPAWEEVVKALGGSHLRQVEQSEKADVEIHTCCGWSRAEAADR